MLNNKEKYRVLCKTETTIPVFLMDWWMDAVCGIEAWDVLLVEKGSKIAGAMPYYLNEHKKSKMILEPPLTQVNGVWIKYPPGQKYSKKLSYDTEIMGDIIDQLESLKINYYNQNFHYSVTNWLPFYWRGFQQTTRYTYVIDDIQNIEKAYANFYRARKRDIALAADIVTVKCDLSAEEFYDHQKSSLEKQGKKISFSYKLFKSLYDAVYKNNAGKTFYAVDKDYNIHSAIFVVWNKMSAYFLICSIDPDFRWSNTNTLLVWEAMKYVSMKTKSFDLEGSMIKNVENYFRTFGAVQIPYFNISKNYRKDNIVRVILKDIYHNSPIAQKLYNSISGGER